MKIKLTEICNPKQWKTIPADQLIDAGYPVYGANGIIGYFNEYNHETPVIAITCRGATCGSINITKPKSYITGNAMCLDDVRRDIKIKYLFYALKNYDFNNVISGSAQPQITRQGLEKVVLNIDINNQEYVVEKLSAIEKIISFLKNKVEFFDDLVKARFVEMFGKEQSTKKLGDLVSICRGASPRPISSYTTKDEDGENWIKIGDVEENDIYINHVAEKVTKAGADKSRRVKVGDFILSNSMSFGRPYILNIDGCVHDGWLIISEYEKSFEQLFLYYLLRSDDVQNQFNGTVSGAVVKNLNSDKVRETNVIVPSKEKQKEFVEFSKQIDKSKFIVQKKIEKYQELMNKLMDEYFGDSE